MARLCSVCSHPQRAEIDLALAEHRRGYRHIAALYGMAWSSLRRHEREHLRSSLRQVQEANKMNVAEFVLNGMRDLHERTGRAMDRCERARDDRGLFYGADIAGRNLHRLFAMGVQADESERARAVEEQRLQAINPQTGYTPEEARDILRILAESGAANMPHPPERLMVVGDAAEQTTTVDEEQKGATDECA